MPIALYIVCVFITFGRKCTPISRRCVKLIRVVHSPTQCHRTSSELVYHFLIEAPFCVLFVDAYKAGNHASFEGDKAYVISCCGMTGFVAMEPVKHATSQTFASAAMKIQLQFGLCHMIVLDKDNKFFEAFKEACDLLQINWHVLSGGNHNPMLVERVNRYLNKGLKVITNERGSVRIAMEAILLLLYAWNSAPINS
jgi:hypothetical protein